jgi:hypothetical protein
VGWGNSYRLVPATGASIGKAVDIPTDLLIAGEHRKRG